MAQFSGRTDWTNETVTVQSTSAVQPAVQPCCQNTAGLVIKLSDWRLERVLFNFPANIVSRPVFGLIGELGGGNLVSVTCGTRH